MNLLPQKQLSGPARTESRLESSKKNLFIIYLKSWEQLLP